MLKIPKYKSFHDLQCLLPVMTARTTRTTSKRGEVKYARTLLCGKRGLRGDMTDVRGVLSEVLPCGYRNERLSSEAGRCQDPNKARSLHAVLKLSLPKKAAKPKSWWHTFEDKFREEKSSRCY